MYGLGGIKAPLFVYVNAAYVCLKGWIDSKGPLWWMLLLLLGAEL